MANKMQEIITVAGGMVTDLARNVMDSNVASFLKNAITDYNNTVGNGQGQSRNIGVVTPVISNTTNFEYELPEGQNVCIGARYDRKLNQLFWFNYNSNSDHQFWVYDAALNTFTLVWQDALFNFNLRYLITSIDVVIADISTPNINVQNLQRLVYWTDGFNPPRKMNVDTAINGGYSSLTFLRSPDEFMNAVKYPPLDVNVTNTLPNPDPSYLLNFVANKEFQFRYRYYYEDGEHSTWSAISIFAYSTITEKNFIELTMSAGSSLVVKVELAFNQWEGISGDWKSYDIILRDAIIANVVYPYSAVTNTFKYKFFNNQAYNILDQVDTNRLYDTLPLKAGAQEFVEQNILLYGNNLMGYNNLAPTELIKPTVDIVYEDYAPLTLTLTGTIAYTSSGGGAFNIEVHLINFQTGDDTVVKTYAVDNTDPSPLSLTSDPAIIDTIGYGDKVYLYFDGDATQTLKQRTLIGTYTNIFDPLSGGTGDFTVNKAVVTDLSVSGIIPYDTIVSDSLDTWDVTTYMDTCPNTSTGKSQLKQGGKYKLGLICYDDALRSTFVQLIPNCILNIESIQEAEAFQTFAITIDWNSIVFPSWVKYVKLCRTKNLNLNRQLEQGYLQISIQDVEFIDYDGSVAAVNANTKTVRFTLTQLVDFNTNNYENTTTTYTWTKGDRVQFIRNGDGSYFDFATYGLIDAVLSTDPAAVDVNYQCPFSEGLTGLVDGAWVELYTPAKENQTDIYYEIGDFIPTEILDGQNKLSVTSTTLTTFDTYAVFWHEPYVDDLVTDNGETPFEHHSIFLSGAVPSSGEDIGRENIVNADARQLWYPARIVWSNAYLPNTYWNGLSTFKEENKKDFFRQYGSIVQLFADQTRLLVLQEDNHFRAMLAKKLVTLADGSVMVITSDEFISDPIEINGDFGCQNSESFVEWDGRMWWNDVKRGAMCECNWQDTVDISRIGANKSYVENKDKFLYRYNQNEHTTQTCCWNMNGWTPLNIGDQIKVTSFGVVYTITVEEGIGTLDGIVSLLEINGFGDFTANNFNQTICTTSNDNDLSELDLIYYEGDLGLRMLYDDIANVPVADAEDVADWNTFFDLPANGTPFTSVSVDGNEVTLFGGSGITIVTDLFSGDNFLVEIHDDSGCVVECEQTAFYAAGSLTIVELNSCVLFGISCFEYCIVLTDFSATSALTIGDTCFASCTTLAVVNVPLVESFGDSCFFTCLASFVSFVANNATDIGDSCFYACASLTNISILSCTNLGSTTGDNGVFNGITGKNITIACPPALLTCDGGDPNGDLQYLIANNTVIVNDAATFSYDNFFAVALNDTPNFAYYDNATWLSQVADVGFGIGQNIVGADANWEHYESKIGGYGFTPDNTTESVVTPRVGIGGWLNEIQNYNPDSAMVTLQRKNNDTGLDFITVQTDYVLTQGQSMIFMVNVCHGTVDEMDSFLTDLITAGVEIAEVRLGNEVSTSASSGSPNTSMSSDQYISAAEPFVDYLQANYGGIPITLNAAKRNKYLWSNEDIASFAQTKSIKLFSQYLWIEASSSETNQVAYFNDILTKLRVNLYDEVLPRIAGYYTVFSGMSMRVGQGGTNNQLSGYVEGTMLQAIMLWNQYFEIWDYNNTHNNFVSGFTFLTNTKAVNLLQGKDSMFSIDSYYTSTDGIHTFVTRTTAAAIQMLSVMHDTTDNVTYIPITLTGVPDMFGAVGFQVGGYVYVFIYNGGVSTTISSILVDAVPQTNTTREAMYGSQLYASIGTCPAFNVFGGTPVNVERVEGAISAAGVVIESYSVTKLFLTDVSGASTIELIWS